MTRTQDSELPISRAELAKALGMAKETLAYYYRSGMIPRPRLCGNCCYYTADEAQQIVLWWEARKKLTFDSRSGRRTPATRQDTGGSRS